MKPKRAGPRSQQGTRDELFQVLYKLVEEIGGGGMGSVFMAQQTEPVKRAVAVKVIKAGMDSKAVLARFDAERQALALMDHPNIARVLDAGATDGGRPFFCHGTRQGRTHHRVLRCPQVDAERTARAVRAGVPGDPTQDGEGLRQIGGDQPSPPSPWEW
jgi:hypothetical protein